MTKEQFFSLLLKVKRNERVYIWAKSDEMIVPINWYKGYNHNDLFINMLGDIITSDGKHVGNLEDYNIAIAEKLD